jgi:hypothetical protein
MGPPVLTEYGRARAEAHELVLSGDGKVGIAISPDGDLQNVFNNGGARRAATEALLEGLRRGGKTLDCFDGFLPDFYAQFGFSETGGMQFNRDFALPGWDYKADDEPDVVFPARMEIGESDDSIRERVLGDDKAWITGRESRRYYDDFDQAKADARRAIGGGLGGSPEGKAAHRAGSKPGAEAGARTRALVDSGHCSSGAPICRVVRSMPARNTAPLQRMPQFE